MKRLICIIMILSLTVPLLACSTTGESLRNPVNFYYRTRQIEVTTPSSVISAEPRESFGHTEDYAYLIEQYLRGPTTEKCISPFPAGTTLVQLDLVKDKVLVVLSSHLSLLSGAELTIACTCLGKTLSEMTGMKSVQISAMDDLLDSKASITVSEESFLLEDPFTGLPVAD